MSDAGKNPILSLAAAIKLQAREQAETNKLLAQIVALNVELLDSLAGEDEPESEAAQLNGRVGRIVRPS